MHCKIKGSVHMYFFLSRGHDFLAMDLTQVSKNFKYHFASFLLEKNFKIMNNEF